MNKYYIETFGCQMNKYDSELVATMLKENGYQRADRIEDTDIILINTCSVREHAEVRVKNKLDSFQSIKKHNKKLIVGVLGCMAQRLGFGLIDEKPIVDFVIGPDSYRNLIKILDQVRSNNGRVANNTDIIPNEYETYEDIYPTRTGNISGWIAIMRGCNNFCSYCIVPYVRGRERSRSSENILTEVKNLVRDGYREVILLGQNVNSYQDNNIDFADLIGQVSKIEGIQRVRFATSHPKDLSEKLIRTIVSHENICNHIHLPVQSGSDEILKAMNRNYSRDHYISLIETIRKYNKDTGIYTDIIVGFPGETEEDFQQTYELVRHVQFDSSFIFKYSTRSGTAAAKFDDNVPEAEKTIRLQRLNDLQKRMTLERNKRLIGSVQKILIEGPSKKNKDNQYMGRTDSNKITVFQKDREIAIGSIIDVRIIGTEGQTLFGEPVVLRN